MERIAPFLLVVLLLVLLCLFDRDKAFTAFYLSLEGLLQVASEMQYFIVELRYIELNECEGLNLAVDFMD